MTLRRVVTGHLCNKAVIVSDGPPEISVSQAIPGSSTALMWKTSSQPAVPQREGEASISPTFVPAIGETRFMIVTFPPDSVMMSPDFDKAAAASEMIMQAPDFATTFEPDNPGMHTTNTVDYGIVLDGEIWLELDDGQQAHLKAHDVNIQTGTRHAWRNRSDKPATLAFVLIGAVRIVGA